MMQDAAPIGHEEEISVSKDTLISDEWPSRPADCVSSPRSTSVFGFNAAQCGPILGHHCNPLNPGFLHRLVV